MNESTKRAFARSYSKGPGRLMTRPRSGALYAASQWGWFAGLAKQFLLRVRHEAVPVLRRMYLEEARENARVAREYHAVMVESGVEA